ncbi:hypothetical protein [Alkalicoccus chagannorensis]|uniref:hypothetical protein n=1 Tax=Alkalicoccus chagannorensis TaxID=427072 RepID=UPI00041A4FE5|nr:hypothetical protein [Alkalicoccus chagannorensis]
MYELPEAPVTPETPEDLPAQVMKVARTHWGTDQEETVDTIEEVLRARQGWYTKRTMTYWHDGRIVTFTRKGELKNVSKCPENKVEKLLEQNRQHNEALETEELPAADEAEGYEEEAPAPVEADAPQDTVSSIPSLEEEADVDMDQPAAEARQTEEAATETEGRLFGALTTETLRGLFEEEPGSIDVHGELKLLNQALSQADSEVSRMYHEIEFSSFNASQGYALAKALKRALQARRQVKEATSFLRSMKGLLLKRQKLQAALDDTTARIEKQAESKWKSMFEASEEADAEAEADTEEDDSELPF